MNGSGSVNMKMKRESLCILMAFALSGAAVAVGPESLVGKALPTFSFKDVNGKAWSSADLKGNVVVIDCWATWCGPCKAASATMQTMATKYAKRGLVVVAMNGYDAAPVVKKYAAEHKYSFPFVANTKGYQDKLGIENLPAIFVVSRDGKVLSVSTLWNEKSPAAFEKVLVSALK